MLSISTTSTRRALIALTVALGLTASTAAAEVPHHASPEANPGGVADLRSHDAAARIEARQDLRAPDTRDVAAGREYPPTPTVVTIKEIQPLEQSTTGFDWFAAVAGAAAALGLILLMTATVMIVTRRRAHRDQPLAAT